MSKMKRSRHLALTTLMAAASVNLVACGQRTPEPLSWERPTGEAGADEPVDAMAYADPAACKAADEVPDPECDNGWRTAQADHEANAPRYGDKAACEAEYGEGRCETRSSGGGSFFMPFLAGMMIGRMTGLGGGGGYYRGSGLYRDRLGRVSTPFAGAGALSRNPSTGRLQVARSALEPTTGARSGAARAGDNRAVSRGGFRSTRNYAGRGFGG